MTSDKTRNIGRICAGITLCCLIQTLTTPASASTNRFPDVPRPAKAVDAVVAGERFLPDLIVTQFKVTELTNDHIKWFYTIQNIGQVAVSRVDVSVQAAFFRYELDPSRKYAGYREGYGAGGTEIRAGNAILPGGKVSGSFQAGVPQNYLELPYLYLIVDAENKIAETIETNNILHATFVNVHDQRDRGEGASAVMGKAD